MEFCGCARLLHFQCTVADWGRALPGQMGSSFLWGTHFWHFSCSSGGTACTSLRFWSGYFCFSNSFALENDFLIGEQDKKNMTWKIEGYNKASTWFCKYCRSCDSPLHFHEWCLTLVSFVRSLQEIRVFTLAFLILEFHSCPTGPFWAQSPSFDLIDLPWFQSPCMLTHHIDTLYLLTIFPLFHLLKKPSSDKYTVIGRNRHFCHGDRTLRSRVNLIVA